MVGRRESGATQNRLALFQRDGRLMHRQASKPETRKSLGLGFRVEDLG